MGARGNKPFTEEQLTESLYKRLDDGTFIEPYSGCWLWCRHVHIGGYGMIGSGDGLGKNRYVHRVSYERHKGKIPEGLHINHLCRVRSCLNPAHLEAVTNAENVRRGGWSIPEIRRAREAKKW